MRARRFGQGLVLLALVLAIALSTIFLVDIPVSAAGFVDTNYSGKVIEVTPGSIFVLRTELTWDEVGVPGYYLVQIVWEDNNRADENFTVLYARAFIDNDNDNTPAPDNIFLENTTVLTPGAGTNGTRYVFLVRNDTGNDNDGKFDVEIYVQAASRGTPHRAPWDNHPINKSGWGGVIRYAESEILTTTPKVTTIKVTQPLWGVDVAISPPDFQENLPGENLAYTVTVTNIGRMPDNYNLTKGDNAGWGDNVWLENYQFLNVENGGIRTTTLHVHIPENAIRCTYNNIWVAATSVENENVKDNASCIAHVMARGVEVSIYPPENGAWPGENATFTVTVTNMRAENDNYTLKIDNTLTWTHTLDNENLYDVPPGGSGITTLRVRIPEDLRTRLEDNITVTATSRTDNTLKDNASCIAYSIIIRGVEVSISPAEKTGLRGWTLTYTVTVWNRGSIKDNFKLENKDNFYWPMVLDDNRFDDMLPNENRPTTLRVTIPDNAAPSTRDNVRVIAILDENENVRAENSCIAHLAQVNFEVAISPENQSRFRGENLTYTVTLRNTTTDDVDFQDNYYLTIGDNSGWPLSLPENRIENVGRDNENSKTFTVTIPDNATPCTRDNVTITAISQADNRENRSGSCIAHSLAVYVSISPSENSALPGDNLTYAVSIWSTSTSSENDNFTLAVSDNSGWGPTLSENLVKLSMGRVENVTLNVTIPENAVPCTRDNITVTVTSENDNTVTDNASCIAHAGYAGVSVSITPENKEGFQGENLIYTVTVKNTGTITDNFRLENWDTLGWLKALNNDRFDSVPPGENRTTTLTVTVSWYFPPGTSDNITVRATSAENENVSAENSCIAHSKLFEERTYPTDDAHVRFAARGSNYSGDNLYVGMLEGSRARSFLKFKLPTVPVGWTVENVWLYLYSENLYYGENVQCHRVDNDGWSENNIIWNNQPSIGDNLDGPKEIVFDPPPGPWLNSWNVTDFVRGQYQVDNVASFAMIGVGENIPPNHWVMFLSKENITYKPYLRILYRPSRDWVRVSISRENAVENYAYDYPGRTVEYRVTVKNIGWENNSYRLENWDNLGWALALENALFDNVPPGENKPTTLRVKIPDNAAPGTEDKITVRVTSVDNESIWDENSCIAQSVLPTASILPSYQEGYRGENLRYTVRVTNPTTYSKGFNLTVEDNAGTRRLEDNITVPNPRWYPTLDNENITIWAESHGERTLSVIVSWYSPQATSDKIIVRITSVENENIRAEASCIAFSKGEILRPEISRIDDSLVWGKYPDNKYGDNDYLRVGRSEDNPMRIFLKFDLRGVSLPEGSKFAGGTLLLRTSPGWHEANVRCYRVDNDNWSENTITWGNMPQEGEPISGSVEVTGGDNWYEWAISEYLLEQFENDKIVSLCLIDAEENSPPDHLATFYTHRDWPGYLPRLVIAYSLGRYEIHVSVSPENQSRPRWENIIYTVTVKNLGWEKRNYNLSVGDNENWKPTIDNLEQDMHIELDPENLPRWENEDMRRSPISSRWHEIWPTFSRWYHLKGWVDENRDNVLGLGDIISLDNIHDENTMLTWWHEVVDVKYDIVVSQTGENKKYLDNLRENLRDPENSRLHELYPDNSRHYTLENWIDNNLDNVLSSGDNIDLKDENGVGTGWHVDNVTITMLVRRIVPPGENGTWMLRVRIPENAAPGTKDNITITVIAQDNENARTSISCAAHYMLVYVEITPPKVTSVVPGDSLTYSIKVLSTSTSEENDNFTLTVSDNSGWGLSIDNENIKVSMVENGTATLTVTVPENARVCTQDTITVTAISQADNTVRDNASCTAHAGYVGLTVSVSPNYQWPFPGDNIKYDVWVTNTGTVIENCELVKVKLDNENWAREIVGRSDFENVDPGVSERTSLVVHVPSGAPHYAINNVTFTWKASVARALSAENIKPPDNDAYVWEEEDERNKPHNTNSLVIGAGKIPWLKFNLSLPENAENLVCAKLWLYFDYSYIPQEFVRTGAYFSENDNWDEDTITWDDNHPRAQDPTDSIDLGTGWKSWDVTKDVLRELENDKIASWCLINDHDEAGARSKEYDDYDPYLEVFGENRERGVEYAESTCTAHVTYLKFNVEISPEIIEGLPGDTVVFTSIKVKNNGLETDDYRLTVVDDAGWENLKFDENSFSNVQKDLAKTTSLRVRIPDNAMPGMRDNLKVIVTSGKDPRMENSDNCVVVVGTFRRGVRVSIEPSYKEGEAGGSITFTVKVTNMGEVRDNFALSASDNQSWSLSVFPSSLSLGPGTLGNATLSVIIPAGAENCTRDNIKVIARSVFDNTVENENSCIAHATRAIPPVVRGVEVTISPAENTGLPDENLTFTATVGNTGEVEDSYDLTVSDDAGWGATLSGNLLTIPAGENLAVIVSVTVPSDAVKGDSTMITVTATSRGDPTKSDSATCIATAEEKPLPTSEFPFLPIGIGAAAVGGGATIAILLKKGIIHLPSPRSHSWRRILRMLSLTRRRYILRL